MIDDSGRDASGLRLGQSARVRLFRNHDDGPRRESPVIALTKATMFEPPPEIRSQRVSLAQMTVVTDAVAFGDRAQLIHGFVALLDEAVRKGGA